MGKILKRRRILIWRLSLCRERMVNIMLCLRLFSFLPMVMVADDKLLFLKKCPAFVPKNSWK